MRSGHKPNKWNYRGIYFESRFKARPFRVKIWDGEKSIRLGGYDNPHSAAQAYDRKAFELWGNEATLNFPRPKWTK